MKKCVQCFTGFEISDADRAFYQKMEVPEPTKCPACRQKQRLSFRNLRNLYSRKCDFSGRSIVSCYDTDCKTPVYHADIWWGDQWDPLSYGRDFDFNRVFFEQCAELFRVVPLLHHYVILSENCEYINGAGNCKNCYLGFNLDYCEDCHYLTDSKYVKATLDSHGLSQCELCYECLDSDSCYNLFFSQRCAGCSDSLFLADCRQCSRCIGCCNLVGKEYYVFNKRVTPAEFESLKEALRPRVALEDFFKKFKKFLFEFPKKYYRGHSNEHFSGDQIFHLKNSTHCFDASELEDCHYCYYLFQSNHCQDFDIFGDHSQWIYNCMATGFNCTHDIGCLGCWNGSSHNAYCHLVSGTSDCFGCSGLKHKKYCILNKQYSKEDYIKLRSQIVSHMRKTGEWGQYFPPSMSFFGYNETVSGEFYPLTKEQTLSQGFHWKDRIEKIPDISKIIPGARLPDTIKEIPDDILNWAIQCPVTGRYFRLTPQELKFYRDHHLPVPALHPDERYRRRMTLRNPRKLWKRACAKCTAPILTTYAPERPEIVYCEACYLKEVY